MLAIAFLIGLAAGAIVTCLSLTSAGWLRTEEEFQVSQIHHYARQSAMFKELEVRARTQRDRKTNEEVR